MAEHNSGDEIFGEILNVITNIYANLSCWTFCPVRWRTQKQTSLPPSSSVATFQLSEWTERAEKFHEICRSVGEMFVRLTETSNRALLYDLYPYVWDVKEVLQLLDTFVNWLSTKNKRKKQKGQSFFPEDPEPWVFRGGLCGELQVWCTFWMGKKKCI